MSEHPAAGEQPFELPVFDLPARDASSPPAGPPGLSWERVMQETEPLRAF